MADLPGDLAAALDRVTAGVNQDRLATVTGRLIDRYQADHPAEPGRPIMAGEQEARAYAAYRMPATYAAIRAVLDQLPDLEPDTHLDVAGGTGVAIWAVADRWTSIRQHTVLEQAPAAIKLGRTLAAGADRAGVRQAHWQQMVFGERSGPLRQAQDTSSTGSGPLSGSGSLPRADVITVGYLLSEIDESLQQQVIRASADAAGELLIIVEPGTKKGYRRIISAREQLLAAGMSLVAPCPHQLRCPLQDQDRDWCHFAARVNRSPVHRRAKGAELGYEDEKFSYLVVAPPGVDVSARAESRVLRHPQYPKGRVRLELCQRDGTAAAAVIAKRDKETYRLARKVEWGDGWPDVRR
ncbi:rRNA methyltransferase [Microlunatus elymi]|uniref:rRNA methyltransferase n=1 Tax=Microlunatus elymi TaxID=2596828 RepID=A0A516PX66_9ACTN|nr:small ribosomal subunit Rsm22 family protein [Microlunatus elymi]QDP95769.1 rRNA methyltransferase [Microlunatus elymi]